MLGFPDHHHQRLVLSCISYDFILNIIMLLSIMFLVYSSSTFDIVMIGDEFMYMFVKRLALFAGGLNDSVWSKTGRRHRKIM